MTQSPPVEPRTLQSQPGRTVVLEPGGRVVRKTFEGGDALRRLSTAEREFDRMRRFTMRLAQVPGAVCPRPLEVLQEGPRVHLRMELAAGRPLRDELDESAWDPVTIDSVADVIAGAVIAYVETFEEPYWDFIFRNMYYDASNGRVTFLDYGVPDIFTPALAELSGMLPLDVSLGSMVASAIFESTRARHLARRCEHRQSLLLAEAVLQRCEAQASPGTVSRAGVLATARTEMALASSGGGLLRQVWYRSVGPLIGRPASKLAAFAR